MSSSSTLSPGSNRGTGVGAFELNESMKLRGRGGGSIERDVELQELGGCRSR
jgi:hypothetical protein